MQEKARAYDKVTPNTVSKPVNNVPILHQNVEVVRVWVSYQDLFTSECSQDASIWQIRVDFFDEFTLVWNPKPTLFNFRLQSKSETKVKAVAKTDIIVLTNFQDNCQWQMNEWKNRHDFKFWRTNIDQYIFCVTNHEYEIRIKTVVTNN